jgi:hypothetical protein
MVTCPVCEQQQQPAQSCSVCGTPLSKGPAAASLPSAAPLEGLESTAYGETLAGESDATPLMPGLEVTRFESSPIAPVPEGLGIEVDLGRADRVGELPAGGMAELEPSRMEDKDPRTVLPAQGLVCRYCRRQGAPGSFCEGCGMKLPRLSGESRAVEQEWGRCPSCGARTVRGAPCSDCGVAVPGAEG